MFRFVELNDLPRVLGIGYDHSVLRHKVNVAKQTGEKQFSQGLTIDPRNGRVCIFTPRCVYRVI